MAQPTSSDQDLWKIYAAKLSSQVLQGQALGGSNRFYIPPLNTAGIMAGPNTSQAITNYGLAVTGDSLISPDNPLLIPSGDTYSKRVLGYLRCVQLQNNVDAGLKQVRDQRQKDFDDASDNYWTVFGKAQDRYKSFPDPNKGDFNSWSDQYFPQLSQATQNRDAAQGALDQVLSQIQGPGWASLKSSIDNLVDATNYTRPTGSNMEVDSSLVGAAGNTGVKSKEYRPHYNFGANSTYPAVLNQWVQKASQPGAATTDISFDISERNSYKWSDLGFSSVSFNGSTSFGPFFTASYNYNGQEQHENVSIQDNASSIKVKISATGIEAFDVAPDSTWDPGNVKKTYPKLFAGSSTDLLGPLVQVRKIIVGYNVTVSISLDQSTYDSIKQTTSKASSQGGGGSINIFGFNIGVGGGGSRSDNESTSLENVKMSDSDHTITFPGANNLVPLLLGVVGTVVDA